VRKYEAKIIGPEPSVRGPEDEYWVVMPNEFAYFLCRHGRLEQKDIGLWEGEITEDELREAMIEAEKHGVYWGKGRAIAIRLGRPAP